MAKLDQFIKSVVRSDYGMSIRDVMATDYEHLMAVLGADDNHTEVEEDEEVLPLGEILGLL